MKKSEVNPPKEYKSKEHHAFAGYGRPEHVYESTPHLLLYGDKPLSKRTISVFRQWFNPHNLVNIFYLPTRFWSLEELSEALSVSIKTIRVWAEKYLDKEDYILSIGKVKSFRLPTSMLWLFLGLIEEIHDFRYVFFTFKEFAAYDKLKKKHKSYYLTERASSVNIQEAQYLLHLWSGLDLSEKIETVNFIKRQSIFNLTHKLRRLRGTVKKRKLNNKSDETVELI